VYPSHWRFVRTLGSFGVFANTRARGWAWATDGRGGAPGSDTSVAAVAPSTDGDQTITVRTATPVDLVRSMSFTPGWHATSRSLDGGARAGSTQSLGVTADGLVQQVVLPAGDWAVTFTYRPSSAVAALVVSALAGVLMLGWLVVDLGLVLAGRRRRRQGVRRVVVQPGERSPMASAARR
jgi:hypothetical protein